MPVAYVTNACKGTKYPQAMALNIYLGITRWYQQGKNTHNLLRYSLREINVILPSIKLR